MNRNLKMIISYDGTRYQGWEHQPGTDMTIQGKLERVVSRMLSESEDENKDAMDIKIIGAGRTDAGVHARAMTANVSVDTDMSDEDILEYMNLYLPEDISIQSLHTASERFHSRYMAKGKTYRYTLWRGASKPVFDRRYVTVLKEDVDIEAMKAAASFLQGTHDFRSFCANTHMKKSSVRRVDTVNIETSGNYIRLYFHGNGFLQGMVRIMTGTLLEVGCGRLMAERIPEILEGRDRGLSGPSAPAKGLCLMKVDY